MHSLYSTRKADLPIFFNFSRRNNYSFLVIIFYSSLLQKSFDLGNTLREETLEFSTSRTSIKLLENNNFHRVFSNNYALPAKRGQPIRCRWSVSCMEMEMRLTHRVDNNLDESSGSIGWLVRKLRKSIYLNHGLHI